MACAAALAAIDVIIEENLPEKARKAGEIFISELQQMKSDFSDIIMEIRGMGCFIGVEFAESDIGGLMISALASRKVLVAFALNNPKVLRIEPPLDISRDDISRLMDAFREATAEIADVVRSFAGTSDKKP